MFTRMFVVKVYAPLLLLSTSTVADYTVIVGLGFQAPPQRSNSHEAGIDPVTQHREHKQVVYLYSFIHSSFIHSFIHS